jgi:26S proteasome regulatory subunit N1
MEPKVPDDIYKTHLTEIKITPTQKAESARLNLASTFVNAFVNAGFGKDKLMIVDESNSFSHFLILTFSYPNYAHTHTIIHFLFKHIIIN